MSVLAAHSSSALLHNSLFILSCFHCSLTLLSVFQVFEAMISWIKHDKPARLEYMPKLMEYVRLPLLSRDYLVQVKHYWHIIHSTDSKLSLFFKEQSPALNVVKVISYSDYNQDSQQSRSQEM